MVPQTTAGPQRIVMRPQGWEAASDDVYAITKPGHFYRGMTEDEFQATLGRGSGVQSRQDFSVANEGTSFSNKAEDAESYANYGRDDPRKTGRPTYLVEIAGEDGLRLDRDGYWKADGPITPDRITRLIRMAPENGAVVGEVLPTPRTTQSLGSGLVPESGGFSFEDFSRAADSPEQKAARDAASQPPRRANGDQAIREQFGRPWEEVAPAKPGSAERSALAKLWVMGPTSRWFTRHFLDSCTNSIGSSTVSTWPYSVSFRWLTIAASVVDLPEPVGPVTSTRPRGL